MDSLRLFLKVELGATVPVTPRSLGILRGCLLFVEVALQSQKLFGSAPVEVAGWGLLQRRSSRTHSGGLGLLLRMFLAQDCSDKGCSLGPGNAEVTRLLLSSLLYVHM